MPSLRASLQVLAIMTSTLSLSAQAADEPPPDDASTPAPVERAPLAPRSDTIAADLLRQLPGSEFISLKAGTEDVVALWRHANVGEPKGVVVLLPGEGESADWPRGIGPLRRGLPDYGWHTLSLSLPDLPSHTSTPSAEPELPPSTKEGEAEDKDLANEQPPSEAGYLPEETATPAGESPPNPTEASAAVADPAEQINERIEAALAFARSKQPTTIVLLGQGTGAYWSARYLQQLAPADVKHLLMIQPRQPEGQQEAVAQLVPALKLATGDFYSEEGSATLSAARERLNASRRLQHPSYRQVKLPPPTGNVEIDQERLLRRIRGWLDKQ